MNHSATIRKLYRHGEIVGTTVFMTNGDLNFRVSFDGAGTIVNPDDIETVAMTAYVTQINDIDPETWDEFAHKVLYGTLRLGEVQEIEFHGRKMA